MPILDADRGGEGGSTVSAFPMRSDKLTGALRRRSVKKHVAAVHMSGRPSLLQRKLFNALLLNAYDRLGHMTTFEIDASSLTALIGYDSHDNESLKASLRGLAETVFEWSMLDDLGRQEWGVSSVLSYATLKGGICRYGYSPALAEKLHDPKVFALIDLDIQRRFASGHALALYENCYRFVRTGSTGWWSLETFRQLMGVDGSTYYQTFKHLNAKIVKPAVFEVNRASNIVIVPEMRKRGRAVVDIRFQVTRNADGLAVPEESPAAEAAALSPARVRLATLGVAEGQARTWLAELGEAALVSALDRLRGQGDVRHPERYLKAILKGDGRAGQGRLDDRLPSEDRQARVRDLEWVQAVLKGRTPTQRDADKRLFASRLRDAVARDDFDKHGWMSPLNRHAIRRFFEETGMAG